MSQTLTLELGDEAYTAIRRQAETAGMSPAHWTTTTLEQQYGSIREQRSARAQQTEAEKQVAREHFERHFGEIDLDYATGIENEQIDADLAREYAATHEEN